MATVSVQAKYPNAIWFDSAHTGTESGTFAEPYNTIAGALAAVSNDGQIAVKDGTHNVGEIAFTTSGLTIVGASTAAILRNETTGDSIDCDATTGTFRLETIKVVNDSTSWGSGVIASESDMVIDGCIIDSGGNIATSRGFLANDSTDKTFTIENSIIIFGTGSGYTSSLTSQGSTPHTLNVRNSNLIMNPNSADVGLSHSPAGEFKNSILIGKSTYAVTIGSWSPSVIRNCCFFKTAYTTENPLSGATNSLYEVDPKFIDPTNGDYRLRPNSPLIGGAQSSLQPTSDIYLQPGTGTGSGTLEDPYYFDELSSAHASAGEQGKIIFLDGDYILADNTTIFKGSTYEAKNSGKAIIKSSSLSSLKYISIGDASDNYAVSKFKGLSFVDVGSVTWNNRAIHIGSAVDQFHEFESCTFKLYAADYGFLGPLVSNQAPEFSTKFTGCVFDLIRHEGGTSDGTAPYFYSYSTLPNSFELKNCILKFSTQTDGSLIIVFDDNAGTQEAQVKDTIIFSDPGQRVNLGAVPHYFTEHNVVYNNISNASADPAKNVFVDVDPKFVDASINDFRLRANSPLIGGVSGDSSEEKWIKQAERENKSYIFFDPNASGTGDGLSLANACTDVVRAVNLSDSGGYVFVADMDYTISGTRYFLKPVMFQALNPGKATWRQISSNGTIYFYSQANRQAIWGTAIIDSGDSAFGNASNNYTSDKFQIMVSNLPNLDDAMTGFTFLDSFDNPVKIINHTFENNKNYITLEREADLSALRVGNQYMWFHDASSSDYGFRGINLIDFNTDANANGNGITIFIDTGIFGTLPVGTFIFEGNKLLQTSSSNIVSNSKTGLGFRSNNSNNIKFSVKSNCFSQTNYTANIKRYVQPIFQTASYTATNGVVENNSFYYSHPLDDDGYIHLGGTKPESFKNNLFVYVNTENSNRVSTETEDATLTLNNNYFYNTPNVVNNLNIMPFIDPENADFRIRPNSDVIGTPK